MKDTNLTNKEISELLINLNERVVWLANFVDKIADQINNLYESILGCYDSIEEQENNFEMELSTLKRLPTIKKELHEIAMKKVRKIS